jgi:hypothetical protein
MVKRWRSREQILFAFLEVISAFLVLATFVAVIVASWRS